VSPEKRPTLSPATRRFLAQLHGSIAEALLSYAVEFPGAPLVPATPDEQIRLAERLTLFAIRRVPIVRGEPITKL
jgi:hypothetical protein